MTVLEPVRHRYYRFGPNVLDCLRSVLWQDGVEVPLTPRVFDILCTLVERRGALVTKDDFMRLVWGGVAVEDNNLARQISTLRKLLHERPGQREYIATVTGVGYRFVGTVTAFDETPEDLRPIAEPMATGDSTVGPSDAVAEAPTAVENVNVREVPAVPDDRSGRRVIPTTPVHWTLAIGGLAAAAVALVLAWPNKPTRAANTTRTLWQFTHGSGSQSDPAWSPDGTRLALVSDRTGNADIWVHGVNETGAIRLTTSAAHDRQPSWAPDGRALVFRSERDGGGLYVVPAAGGPDRLIVPFGSHPRWSPDGRQILFSQTAPDSSVVVRLFVVPAQGGRPERVMHPALAGLQVTSAAWAPDGQISVWTRDEAGGRHFITFPLGQGPASRSELPAEFSTLTASTQLGSFLWAPSGRFLYFEGRTRTIRNIWRVTVDPATRNWIDGPQQLTIGPGADVGLTLSPDGSRLSFAVNTARPGIWAFGFDPATGTLAHEGQQIISGTSGERGADVSNDGRRLVYRLDRGNRQEIWGRQLDGEPRLLVSERDANVTVPRWSPDHSRIAYLRQNRRGAPDRRAVVVLDVSLPDQPPIDVFPLAPDDEAIPTDWRADGQALLTACRVGRDDLLGICRLDLPTSGGRAIQHKLAVDQRLALYQQRYSPNQRWVSFIAVPRADRSTSTVYVMPADGGPWRALTDGQAYDDKPRWSPDGRVLYFISNRDGRFEVWGRRFDPDAGLADGAAFRVTSLGASRQTLSPYLTDMEMFITPDRLFLPMFEAASRIWMLDQADR